MKTRAYSIIIGSCVIALADALLKAYAIQRLPEDGGRLAFPIDFALHKNPGIAFDIPIPLSIVIILSIVISAWLVRVAWKSWNTSLMRSAAALTIVIGALGNMFDRIINNFTTDYIILFAKSAINLSDILIIAGAILLISYTEHKDAS